MSWPHEHYTYILCLFLSMPIPMYILAFMLRKHYCTINSLCKYLFEFCKLTSRLPLLEFGLSYLTSRQWDMSLSEDAFLYLVRHRFHKKNEKHLVR